MVADCDLLIYSILCIHNSWINILSCSKSDHKEQGLFLIIAANPVPKENALSNDNLFILIRICYTFMDSFKKQFPKLKAIIG